ncbi:hypothetical protein [Meridianimarinicoccus sp. MJW13]|uniref:hypothetical protein n=1 Tax=Meridianimarinicoccus sp. MJW13 TaxID=2720031 RepID=UPI0018673C89|nr:hypothetical protein [Fluviibacterium sp. MJW13]
MKIARALLWACFALFPTILDAQVTIRSGEHAGFTRLVFYFDQDVDWTLGKVSGGYGLATQGTRQSYDFAGVFDRIPRTRVSSLAQNQTHLQISVACICHARAFEVSPRVLVVDVVDGPAENSSPFERRLTSVLPDYPLPPEPIETGFPPSVQPPEALPDFGESGLPRDQGQARMLDPEISTALARAVFDGVLEPAAPQRVARPSQLGSSPQVLAQTATDLLRPQQQEPASIQCPDAAHLNFIQIAGVGSLEEAVEKLHSRPDEDGSLGTVDGVAVAARYLFLGFGAEARAELEKLGADTTATRLLKEISFQLDAPGRVSSELLGGMTNCPGSAALWGVLGLGAIKTPASVKVNTQAVFHTVSGLPPHLRTHLAPAVSRQLRMLGHDETATAVRSTVARTLAGAEGDMLVEQARAAPEHPDRAALKDLTRSRDLVGLEAQSILLEKVAPGNDAFPAEWQREVEAQILSAKGSREAGQLLASYVQAMSGVGEFEPALKFLSDLAESRFAQDLGVPLAYDDLMGALAAEDQEAEFVYLSAAYFPDKRLPISPENGGAFVDRLSSLGFSTLANRYRSLPVLKGWTRTEPGVVSEPVPLADDLIARRYGPVPDTTPIPQTDPVAPLSGQQPVLPDQTTSQPAQTRSTALAAGGEPAETGPPTLAAQRDLLAQSAGLRERAEALLTGSGPAARESSP